MKPWLKMGAVFLCLAGIAGCGRETIASMPPPAAEPVYEGVSIVQHATEESLLVDGELFHLTDLSSLSSSSGHPPDAGQLERGTLIGYKTGAENSSIDELVIYDDRKSRSISKAINHVLTHQDISRELSPALVSVSHNLVILHLADPENGRLYECILHIKSLDYRIKEISA